MNIYYYAGSTIPSQSANSVQVMKMCEGFSALGHDVTLFCRTNSDETDQACLERYGVSENAAFRLERYRLDQYTIGRTLPFYVHQINRRLSNRPDLIYGRHTRSLLPFLYSGVPILYEAHELPAKNKNRYAEKLLFSAPNFRALVVISNQLKNEYLRRRLMPHHSKIIVAHDAATVPQQPSEYVSLSGDQSFNAGYVGSLRDDKGFPVIPELARRHNQVGFHILGGSEEEVKKWEQKLTNLDNVFFYGHCPHERVFSYMNQMDVLLAPYPPLPPRDRWEDSILPWMSPLKIFEYMSLGKPIITSTLPVLEEVLTHKENALLVEPGSTRHYGEALQTLLDSPSLRSTLGNRAKQDWKTRHTYRQRTRQILDLIDTT